MRKVLPKYGWVILAFASSIFHVLVLIQVYNTGPIPFAPEDWDTGLHFADLRAEGEFEIADLWSPLINSHVVFPARLTIYGSVVLTQWNLHWLSILNYCLGVVAVGLILILVWSTSPSTLKWAVFPVTMFMLAAHRWGSWYSGIYLAWHYNTILLLLTVFFLSREKSLTNFAMGVATAVMASLTMLHGFTVWIAVIPLAFFNGYRHAKWWISWSIVVSVMTFVYFLIPGANETSGKLVVRELIISIPDLVLGYLIFLGTVFGTVNNSRVPIPIILTLFGTIIALWSILLLWRKPENRPFVTMVSTLSLYILLSGALMVLGRVPENGGIYMLARHYVSGSSIYWVGISLLLIKTLQFMIETRHRYRKIYIIYACFLTVLAFVFYTISAQEGMGLALSYIPFQECVFEYVDTGNYADGCETIIATEANAILLDNVQQLKQYELSGFAR